MSDAYPVDEETLPLHAERLSVSRRVVETVVRATRTTTTRDEVVDETVSRDDVEIERVPVGRIVDTVPPPRQEGDFTVYPVVEEIVVVERRLLLKEEVRVRRVRSTAQHTETVSLRRQDAVVTRTRIEAPAAGTTAMADARPSATPSTQPIVRGTPPMDGETIVAVYDTPAHAALALADLKQAGVPESAITMHGGEAATTTTTTPVREEGFWASLFGGEPDHDTAVYDRSVASGSTVVTVKASEVYSAKAAEILESHSPVDMDARALGYGLSQTTTVREPLVGTVPAVGAVPATTAEGGTLQLSEERLSVGKRLVNRGGTRIRRFVVETPVEEQVSLHEERVTLERRPVTDGRPVTNADFTDKTIEMTETAEEVVVAKQAFVTEEIALKKTATDRVETIHNTVRKEDVEIVEVPGETVTTTAKGPATPIRPAKI